MQGSRHPAAEIRVTRGGHIESVHAVHAQVSVAGGETQVWGDPDCLTFMRSSAKPIQALPLIEDGVLERVGLTEEAIVMACASHNGESEHVTVAAQMLAAFSCTEDQLACGGHASINADVAEKRMRAGDHLGPLDSNCSGKHAGMLGLAKHHGWDTEGYHLPEHPVQKRMAAEVSRWTGLPMSEIATATDGCGVVCYAVPLRIMAGMFVRYAEAVRKGSGGPTRITRAIRRYPYLLGGSNRLCSDIVRATNGRILAKVGAEGVYAAWIPDHGGQSIGVGVKVEDGATRAVECALVGVLESAGLLEEAELNELSAYRRPPQVNTRGERVGELTFVGERWD